VRRKVGQDGLLLHNYNYRTSAGFPSPVSLENGLNPVPFLADLNDASDGDLPHRLIEPSRQRDRL
jgi:hypothetical protein